MTHANKSTLDKSTSTLDKSTLTLDKSTLAKKRTTCRMMDEATFKNKQQNY